MLAFYIFCFPDNTSVAINIKIVETVSTDPCDWVDTKRGLMGVGVKLSFSKLRKALHAIKHYTNFYNKVS